MSGCLWLVLDKTADQAFGESDFELLSAGLKLSQALSASLSAVVFHEEHCSLDYTALQQRGVEKIEAAMLPAGQPDAMTDTLSDLTLEKKPVAVLALSSPAMANVFPRLAIRTKSAFLSDALDVNADGGKITATRSQYGGNLLASFSAGTPTLLLTVKKKAFPPAPVLDTPPAFSLTEMTIPVSTSPKRMERLAVTSSAGQARQKLEEAGCVVSGGRGMQASENFTFIEQLADALNAAVGASRAVVDAGWRPHAEQVGQTGKTVRPQVYIAVAISGALQHIVGMRNSRTIIAINKDENAPIFKLADLGIVGNALDILPRLIQKIRALKK